MHRPPAFSIVDSDALAIVASRPLAQLVVVSDEGIPLATPVPMMVRGSSLVGHLARPNPVLRHPGAALAIFTGADAYVSPSWYPGKPVDGKVVPTWNYTTVQLTGRLIVHDDPVWTLQLVSDLSDHFEADRAQPWKVTDAPAEWIDALVRGIVGIELVDLQVAGKHKMSQNRSAEDRAAVASGLDALDHPPGSATSAVAAAIRATLA